MASKLQRMKGRRESRVFSMFIHAYFQSPEYAELSPRAVKLLVDLYCQFTGYNNGDFCATWSPKSNGRPNQWPGMRKLGWSSKSQLSKALKELRDRGWIVVTRQGGRHVCSLYAVTFLGINECGGKLDVAANPAPTNSWKRSRQATVIELPRSRRQVRNKNAAPPAGHIDPRHGAIKETGITYCPSTRVSQSHLWRFGAPPHGDLLRIYQAA
jgi:hypothetical protein